MSGAALSTRARGVAGLLSLVGIIVAVLGCVFVARLILRDWDEVTATIEGADRAELGVALVLALAGMTWTSQQWRGVLLGFGEHMPRRVALHAYFVGQLGKYVPGGVWSVVGRAELATRAGVGRAAVYPSVGLSLAATYLGALLLSAAMSPWAAEHGAGSWALLALPIGLVAVHPRVLRVGVRLSERLFGAVNIEMTVPSWGDTLVLVAKHLPAWVFISASTWMTCRALDLDASIGVVLFATPLSWFIGFIALPVPGGVGVREAVFVAATATALDGADAAVVAVISRFVFVAVDILGAGTASAVALVGGARPPLPAPRTDSEPAR